MKSNRDNFRMTEGRMQSPDGRYIIDGKAKKAHSSYMKDGKRGKLNEKTGKVEYEGESKGGLSDLGTTYGNPMPVKKDEKHYPSMSIDIDKMTSLAGLPIGEEVTLKVVAKVRGITERDDKRCLDLEMRRAGVLD